MPTFEGLPSKLDLLRNNTLGQDTQHPTNPGKDRRQEIIIGEGESM